MQLILTC